MDNESVNEAVKAHVALLNDEIAGLKNELAQAKQALLDFDKQVNLAWRTDYWSGFPEDEYNRLCRVLNVVGAATPGEVTVDGLKYTLKPDQQ